MGGSFPAQPIPGIIALQWKKRYSVGKCCRWLSITLQLNQTANAGHAKKQQQRAWKLCQCVPNSALLLGNNNKDRMSWWCWSCKAFEDQTDSFRFGLGSLRGPRRRRVDHVLQRMQPETQTLKWHRSRCLGVNPKIHHSWIPFSCFSVRVLVSCILAHCHTIRAIIYFISNTRVLYLLWHSTTSAVTKAWWKKYSDCRHSNIQYIIQNSLYCTNKMRNIF